jgi:signal transduction histidine kinase
MGPGFTEDGSRREGRQYLTETDISHILDDISNRLREQRNLLAKDPDTLSQVLAHAAATLATIDGAIARYFGDDRPVGATPAVGSDNREISVSIGVGRALANTTTPAQSLSAAAAVYVAAEPVVAECLARYGVADHEREAGRLVNEAIIGSLQIAVTTYIDYLLVRSHRSNRDERRRLARDLHDLAAPAVGMALQSLDMYEILLASSATTAERSLHSVRDSLVDAAQVIHDLAAQTREAVARGGLRHAIVRYANTVPDTVTVDVRAEGDLSSVPGSYCEELYLIAREAIRNSVTHAAPSHIDVHLEVGGGRIQLDITDDGCGFELGDWPDDGQHIGLFSMRERAELLGGEVYIDSSIGVGTAVYVQVSLPDAYAHQVIVDRMERR